MAEKSICGRAGSRHCLSIHGGVQGRRFSGPGWRTAVCRLQASFAILRETLQRAGMLSGCLTAGGSWRGRSNAFGCHAVGVHAGGIKNISISKRRIGLRGASRRYTHACTRAAISAQLMLLDLLGGWTPCCDETCCCDGSEPCWCCGLHAEPPARSAVPAIPSAPEKKELFPPLPYLYARCTNPPQNSSVVSTSC